MITMIFITMNYIPRIAALFFITICLNTKILAQQQTADLLVYNATIYTVDASFSTVGAMVVKNGRILETGNREQLEKKFNIRRRLDAKGAFIYPAFIDAHAHSAGYGSILQRVNLVGTTSWEDALSRTEMFSKNNVKPGEWIFRRGWDQNDWEKKEFPDK